MNITKHHEDINFTYGILFQTAHSWNLNRLFKIVIEENQLNFVKATIQ